MGQENWWTLDQLLKIEQQHNIRARYHFYADQKRKKSLKRWFFDPGYRIDTERMKDFFQKLTMAGGEIGLHPSYDTWQATMPIAQQVNYLSEVTEKPIVTCRQHWLRFSWKKTWKAQQESGIEQDTTLMFNDRTGFRNGAVIVWNPWQSDQNQRMKLQAMPTVIMDSHLYDYQPSTPNERYQLMKNAIDECKQVHGKMAVLWHPHTLTKDYGWQDGFDEIIGLLGESFND